MKITSNQRHFMKLQQKFTEIIYRKYDSRVIKIAEIQHKSKQAVLNELSKVILDHTGKDNIFNIGPRDRIILKKEFKKVINQTFANEIKEEIEICKEIHEGAAVDKYMTNEFIFSIGIIDYTLKPIHNNLLKKIINKKIDGKNFSDRIWSNKNKVAKQLKSDVIKFLNGQTDISVISSSIQKNFNANWRNSNRLVRDTIGRVQEEANKVWREEHNIEWVFWDSTLDKRTCNECGSLDGKTFKSIDAPACPAHINCRCTLDSIPSEDWRPTGKFSREDNKSIDYITFEKWKKENEFK